MNTTIQISKETKKLLDNFGAKGDTYEDIVRRVYNLAMEEHMRRVLMSTENTITLAEAKKRLSQEWPE